MQKKIEITYPYFISLIVIIPFVIIDNSLYKSENINSALEAVITVTSLIIGFLGAILPIIMSMKNDSKLVKYVFEKDKDKLFLKYIKHTLVVGITLIVVAMSIFFRDQYVGAWYEKYNVVVLAYFITCFLLCTYRSLSNMLNLIFSNDIEIRKNDISFSKKSTREEEFEKRCVDESDKS